MSFAEPPDWVAVDWGTSNLRAWAVGRDGAVLAEAGSADGMAGLGRDGFEPALLGLVGAWLPPGRVTDVLACGMVGSRQGWIEAPYAAVPCPPRRDARFAAPAARDPRLRVHVLHGLRRDRPADVMRGEETQIAGLLAREPGFEGTVCLPGTHSKWAHVAAGEVVSFTSFLTGELFALLAERSVLRHTVAAEGWDAPAFAAAVEDAMGYPDRLAARLFTLRAEALLHGLAPESARARLSGLLIGAELAGARAHWLGREVALIGADAVARAYATALELCGLAPRSFDATELTLAGLAAAHRDLVAREVRA